MLLRFSYKDSKRGTTGSAGVLDEAEAKGGFRPSGIAAIRLLLLTVCRKNEIVTLRWTTSTARRARSGFATRRPARGASC